MTIFLHDYDSKATELFAQAYEVLQKTLPNAEIHHVGSTAIKGLGGKGIIDILIAIPDWNQKAIAGGKLQELGFLHVHKEVNNRIFFSRVGDTIKNDVHLHLTYIGSSEYKSFLTFRDYLRAHSEEAENYLQLKRGWLNNAKGDRKIYTSSKNTYIASILEKANTQKVIIEIRDTDFNPEYIAPLSSEYTTRQAARGILIHDGKIALLHVTKLNYHKLPGGGLENTETSIEAFKREMVEETGCECTIDNENENNLVTLEWRGDWKLFQTSYIYTAHVKGKPMDIKLTDEEKSNGFELKWIPFNAIEETLISDASTDYESQFIMVRDRAVINHFKHLFC